MNGVEVPASDLPQEVPANDLPDQAASNEVPESDLPDNISHATPGQQALTTIEGLGRGVSAGMTDALAVGMRKGATALGVPEEYLHYIAPNPKDIKARQEVNPVESTGSEIAGNVLLMSKLPQVGSKAINGMIQMGLISAGNEVSKNMLGKGDPADSVAAHIAASSAIGLLTGGIFGKVEKLNGKGFKAIEDAKLGNRVGSFLAGIGHAASFPESGKVTSLADSALTEAEIKHLSDPAFKMGQKLYQSAVSGAKGAATTAASVAGYTVAGPLGGVVAPFIEKIIEKVIGPTASKASQKAIFYAIMKASSEGLVDGLGQVLDHATTYAKGAEKISRGVESLFNASSNEILNLDNRNEEKEREQLKKYIEENKIGEELQDENNKETLGFAKGGPVTVEKPNSIARLYPEQNVLLSSTKGRLAGYLNSIRPVKKPILPFDRQHIDPNAEKDYNKVLDLANNPLSILKKVKNGSLQPKDMKHFTSMYPELHKNLSNKITEHIATMKMDDEKKPKYHTRQSLSLFLGSNLDSTLSQPNMMAAQNVFIMQKAQRQLPENSSKVLSKLGQNAQTPEQSREQRLNKS